MILYNSETTFILKNKKKITKWINNYVEAKGFSVGEINYIFCGDKYLNTINQRFLKHDNYTDIVSFDYSVGKELSGDIFISIERIIENADTFNVSFNNELHRVMIHGILHYMGYKDNTTKEKMEMRNTENNCLKLLSS